MYIHVVDEDTKELTACLACGESGLLEYLSLGNQPLANDFVSAGIEMKVFPLRVNLCKGCFHSQLSITVNPNRLFRNYLYVSGTTNTLRAYFDWLSDKILSVYGTGARLLDLASNDGSFLESAKLKGFKILGVDPASNLVGLAATKEVPTICEYWPSENLDFLESRFDVIVAMNVLAHVSNPLEFLKFARNCLTKNGRIYIQTSQAKMFMNGEFDTIYHEHVSFFTARSMRTLAIRAGLEIIEGQYVPVHGTSYLWTLVPTVERKGNRKEETEIEIYEREKGIYEVDTYKSFASTARRIAQEATAKVEEYRKLGFQIWGYGAAAKGNTFINFSGMSLDGIIDDNPLKQGLISPGGGTRVYGIEKVQSLQGKVVFVIPAWNFVDEIVSRLKEVSTSKNLIALTYFPNLSVRAIN